MKIVFIINLVLIFGLLTILGVVSSKTPKQPVVQEAVVSEPVPKVYMITDLPKGWSVEQLENKYRLRRANNEIARNIYGGVIYTDNIHDIVDCAIRAQREIDMLDDTKWKPLVYPLYPEISNMPSNLINLGKVK